ncbi:MAG: Dabb family protein [Acidimicrobiia bacterium]
MIRHVATFTFIDEATNAQMNALDEALHTLPNTIDAISAYSGHRNVGAASNCDYIVIGDFDDMDRYLEYADHPDHIAVIEAYVKPIMASVARIQIEV